MMIMDRFRQAGAWLAKRSVASSIVILFFGFSAVQEFQRHGRWQTNNVLEWDIEAYYHYLPAAIIHGDIRDLSYVYHVDSLLHPEGHIGFGLHVHPLTGHHVIKYTMGTAVFELPLFLVAHSYALLSGSYPADGYSCPYQIAVALSSALFAMLGFWILGRFIRRRATERDTCVALIAIGFGTNLFFYSTFNAGMSHAYLFFLFAAVLLLTDNLFRDPRRSTACWLGLTIGLTVLVRPVDGLVVLIPLLWSARSAPGTLNALSIARRRPSLIITTLFVTALTMLPQLAYWFQTTGNALYYSYLEEGFDFTSPHIIDGLFSYRKGWFVYTPLAGAGVIGLLLMLFDRDQRRMAIPVVIFLAVFCFVVFSWTNWWYGGSFGCRPLVSALALLGLPIAHLSRSLFERHWTLWLAFVLVIAGGIKLNMYQQNQYRRGKIHWDSMTKEAYWKVLNEDY